MEGDERLRHMKRAALKSHNLADELQARRQPVLHAAVLGFSGLPGQPPKFPTIAIGRRDLTFKAHSV